jgi:hypothetical protein
MASTSGNKDLWSEFINLYRSVPDKNVNLKAET